MFNDRRFPPCFVLPMKPSRVGTVAALLLLVVLTFAAIRPLGPLPPLGNLLDPLHGVVGSVRGADLPRDASASVHRLTGAVDVLYDDRGVPHIFAQTISDAYRALGYVTARDRLFQIELQARA